MQLLVSSICHTLNELERVVIQLTPEQFARPLDIFSGSSVGMHTRHIIEFYDCLLWECSNSNAPNINYEKRRRDLTLQSDPLAAVTSLATICNELKQKRPENQMLSLEAEGQVIVTSFERELLYNLEHTIHHMATLRIGLYVIRPDIRLSARFGVAASTIKAHEPNIK